MSRQRMSDEEFVRAWMSAVKEGLCLRELERELGKAQGSLGVRARDLRQRGVALPPLRDGRRGRRKQVPVEDLNALISELS